MTRGRRRRPVRAAVVAALLLAATAPGAAATARAAARPGVEIGMEDERILLGRPDRAPAVVERWAALGVEAVRMHARWGDLAPGRDAPRRPRGFRPGDPDDPGYDWSGLDRAIALLRANHLRVQLTVTGPGPLWASARPGLGDRAWKPRPGAFGAFARAVARRYRGRIARYLVWNEPNIAGWLAPQSRCAGRGRRACTPVAPHRYRRLVRAAVPAIHRADPGSVVLIGELAPIGGRPRSENATIAPLRFLRDLACVDDRFRPMTTGACTGFEPAMGDGFGHHPHGKRVGPTRLSANRDWAKLGDLPRLLRVLDRLSRAGRIRAPGGRFDLYFTEFGYQTSPPDHAAGIPVTRQAEWLQTAAFIAWRHPRIRSLTFYQWEDEPVRWRAPGLLAYAGWQSGLLYVDGRPKPALGAFVAPLVVERAVRAPDVRVWGQIRPGGAHTVTVERLADRAWTPLTTIATDAGGALRATVAARTGDRLRLSWPDVEPASGPPAVAAIRHSGTVVVPAAGARTALAAASRFPPAARSAAAAIMSAP